MYRLQGRKMSVNGILKKFYGLRINCKISSIYSSKSELQCVDLAYQICTFQTSKLSLCVHNSKGIEAERVKKVSLKFSLSLTLELRKRPFRHFFKINTLFSTITVDSRFFDFKLSNRFLFSLLFGQ